MKQPKKPRWKRFFLASVATLGLAGFGGGMMIDTPTIPQNNNDQTRATSVFSPANDPFTIADAFNKQIFTDQQNAGRALQGTYLEEAANAGNLNLVKLLVKDGADVNVNYSGPLYWAVHAGQHDTAKYLIDHGAAVTAGMLESHTANTDKVMSDILTQGVIKQASESIFIGLPYAPPPNTGT